MAYLLLPEHSGTTDLWSPAIAEHYEYESRPEVEWREVDGDDRKVLHMRQECANALAEDGVGEVLPEDAFTSTSVAPESPDDDTGDDGDGTDAEGDEPTDDDTADAESDADTDDDPDETTSDSAE